MFGLYLKPCFVGSNQTREDVQFTLTIKHLADSTKSVKHGETPLLDPQHSS